MRKAKKAKELNPLTPEYALWFFDTMLWIEELDDEQRSAVSRVVPVIHWPDLWFGPINLWNAPKSANGGRMKVVVYSKTNCPQCVVVKRELTLKGVTYEEVNIEQDKDVARWLVGQGHRQVPVVYVDGVHTDPKTITAEII